MIDTTGSLSGWRILTMMLEHEVHHRSQIDTYAGLEGWAVPDIFGRSAETISALQPAQKQKAAARAAMSTATSDYGNGEVRSVREERR